MAEDLTIGEHIVLLALDEKTGTLREAPLRVSLAASAAALLELGFSGHLTERDGTLDVAGASTPSDPAAAAMAERVRSRPGETPRERLMAVREQALDAAYKGLAEKGLVRERRRGRRVLGVFGVFGSVRYPVTGLSELTALRGELTATLVRGQEPDGRVAALITLLHHAGLQAVLPQDSGAETSEDRLNAIAEGHRAAAALGDTIRTTIAALTLAIASAAL
ncbi:GPP34 family phosphoprotein [Streptomyces sp. NPDC059575]|uniref:GOLPH3/VPS74 family protein n=1 Tax=Streptomyces sp. NPDC059575 TaxID=3346872 RepID=UPI0036A9A92A